MRKPRSKPEPTFPARSPMYSTLSPPRRHTPGTATAPAAYYLVPTADAFIAIKGRQADVGVLDDLIDETWDYLLTGEEPTSEFSMEGKTEVLEPQLAGYFQDYLRDELELSDSEIDALGDPLVVRTVNFTACWVLTAIGGPSRRAGPHPCQTLRRRGRLSTFFLRDVQILNSARLLHAASPEDGYHPPGLFCFDHSSAAWVASLRYWWV